jgi:hypothetical protein
MFKDCLVKEVENQTIGWSKDILVFQLMGHGPEINLLETYFDIPPNMIPRLADDLKNTKREDLSNINSKLYKLNTLKTKLPNCRTPNFGDHIEESMPTDISNKNGRIFFLSDHLTDLSGQGGTQ